MPEGPLMEIVREQLTDEEIHRRCLLLAREVQTRFDLQAEKAAASAGFNGQIKEAEERIAKLSDAINKGYVEVEVEVEMYPKPEENVKLYLRRDTGAEIRRVAMSWEERQEWLFDDKPDKGPEPEK